jgi:hypothetical protein
LGRSTFRGRLGNSGWTRLERRCDVAISKTGNVEVRTLETKIFGACCDVGLGVQGLVLGDQDLLRLRR